MWKMRGWSPKEGDLGVKMPVKRENHFFVWVQKRGEKEYETGVLGEETGKTGAEKAFFVQVEELLHKADIQHITQK